MFHPTFMSRDALVISSRESAEGRSCHVLRMLDEFSCDAELDALYRRLPTSTTSMPPRAYSCAARATPFFCNRVERQLTQTTSVGKYLLL